MAYPIPDDPDALELLVIHLATLYDLGEECVDFEGNVVEDEDYDALVRRLKQVKPDSEAFGPGRTSPSGFEPDGDNLVIHNPPMTSIAKADGSIVQKADIYRDWMKNCETRLGHTPTYVQSYKHDGVAVSIVYEKGKLKEAGLRPRNGVRGINVTAHMKYVRGVPQKLPLPVSLTLRGELECLHEDFQLVQAAKEAAGEDLRKNPRNHTAGAMNLKDVKKVAECRISFMGYNIVGFDDHHKYYTTHSGMAKWVNQTLQIPFVRVMPHNFDDLAAMEARVKDLSYEVDGVVLKVDEIEDYEQLGHHGDDPVGDPRGALAWKFEEERAQGVVDHLEWNTARTGRVCPVAVFDKPVWLAGSMVGRATCSNVGWVSRMRIGRGTGVLVYKAGKIIPKIEAVVFGGVSHVDHPTNCPTCGTVLVVVKGHDNNEDLLCQNPDCAARHVEGIAHYLKTVEAKGLGTKKIESMLATGKLKTLADIYDVTADDLKAIGWSERESLLAVATIHHVKPNKDDEALARSIDKARAGKKKIPLWQLFAALGIPGAGKTIGKLLADNVGDMRKILDLGPDDLTALEGIGDTTADAIVDYFRTHRAMVEQLLVHVEPEGPKQGKLSGKTFCLSGSFEDGKSTLEKLISDQGGKVASGVGKKTDYLVAGPGSGAKSDAARELGIPIIDVDTLRAML